MLKIFPLVWMSLAFLGAQALEGATIQTTYGFTGSAGNIVIENGFLTADGVASGSLGNTTGVEFDTHNNINLTTLQNFGTFTMRFPDGSTASGNLHEDDTDVSLETFSGPFRQILTFTGGAGIFVDVSGVLTGGGNIFPTYYTTSGEGTLTGPGLVLTPEPGSSFLCVVGCVLIFLKRWQAFGRRRADEIDIERECRRFALIG